jgi:hypothetical protein
MNRALRLATTTVLAALAAAQPAAATNVTATRLSALAAAARNGDRSALSQLRAVTDVDGHPVEIGSALAGASPSELRARLAALATPRSGEQAPTIAGLPSRTAALLHDLGYRAPTGQSGAEASGGGGGGLPGPAVLWIGLGALIVAASAVVSRRTLRRLEPAVREQAPGERAPAPAATRQSLERDADAAEARGAFSDAVRLRFRAGLLVLVGRSVIEPRTSLRTKEISRRLGSVDFDLLAATFERVAYGGAAASADDAREARERWPRVVAAARTAAR